MRVITFHVLPGKKPSPFTLFYFTLFSFPPCENYSYNKTKGATGKPFLVRGGVEAGVPKASLGNERLSGFRGKVREEEGDIIMAKRPPLFHQQRLTLGTLHSFAPSERIQTDFFPARKFSLSLSIFLSSPRSLSISLFHRDRTDIRIYRARYLRYREFLFPASSLSSSPLSSSGWSIKRPRAPTWCTEWDRRKEPLIRRLFSTPRGVRNQT